MSTSKRPAIHAYVDPESHDGWHNYAAAKAVSVSALIDAIGQQLIEITEAGAVVVDLESAIKEGQKIDSQRRRRTR